MGRRRPFIDKKASTTYNLVYRDGGDGNENGENDPTAHSELAATSTAGRSKALPSVGGVLEAGSEAAWSEDDASAYESEFTGSAWYHQVDQGYTITEERRKEALALGFPDDGYDYLRHVRAIGRRAGGQLEGSLRPDKQLQSMLTARLSSVPESLPHPDPLPQPSGASTSSAATPAPPSAPAVDRGSSQDVAAANDLDAATGPSVFITAAEYVQPAEDIKLVDARRLSVAARVDTDEAAEAATATVSAFARQAMALRKGRLQQEVEELAAAMRAAEHVNTAPTARAGDVGDDEGLGDWLDEFVVTAAGRCADGDTLSQCSYGGGGSSAGVCAAGDKGGSDAELTDVSEGGEQEGVHELDFGMAGLGRAIGTGPNSHPRGPGSVASSFWRVERTDRKAGFASLDAQFEHLALQYEDEEVGDLGADAEAARGAANISQFGSVLDAFLREQHVADAEVVPAVAATARHGISSGADVSSVADGDEILEEGYDEGSSGCGGDSMSAPGEAGPGGLTAFKRGSRKLAAALAAQLAADPEGGIPGRGRHKVATLQQVDAEVVAITKVRMAAAAAAAAARRAAAGSGGGGEEAGCLEFGADATSHILVARPDPTEHWDVESVLSLRSNLDNHPVRISEPSRRRHMLAAADAAEGDGHAGPIKLSSRTGLPSGYGPRGSMLASTPEEGEHGPFALGGDLEADGPMVGSGSDEGGDLEGGSAGLELVMLRPKNETPEERRLRKAAVKGVQRDSRAAKKALKGLFKDAAAVQRRQSRGRAAAGGSTFVIA